MPVRVGLSPTSSRVTSEPGRAAAAVAQNAADDRSPGTVSPAARRRCPPRSVTPPSTRPSSTPNIGRASSVWFRVAAVSLTVVSPAA